MSILHTLVKGSVYIFNLSVCVCVCGYMYMFNLFVCAIAFVGTYEHIVYPIKGSTLSGQV